MSARVVIVTGTGTDVGKTIATAALTVALQRRGERVLVVKPCQTGLQPGEDGDLAVVERLCGGVETLELVRLPDPLAPDAAARHAGVDLPGVATLAARVADAARRDDLDVIVVEGAGGLLVRLDLDGGTLADLALALDDAGLPVEVVVVATAGLGTLNHAALTAEALRSRALPCRGVVIGSWPAEPDLACRLNLADLPSVTGVPLLGRVPEGAGAWAPADFQAAAAGWFEPSTLDAEPSALVAEAGS